MGGKLRRLETWGHFGVFRVATIQVYQRPTLLLEAVRKFSLKSLFLPDGNRILLDGDLPEKKHRWNEAHEVGHSLIPWHGDMMHGDNSHTLSADCHEHIEAEANFAAGRMLFTADLLARLLRYGAQGRLVDTSETLMVNRVQNNFKPKSLFNYPFV